MIATVGCAHRNFMKLSPWEDFCCSTGQEIHLQEKSSQYLTRGWVDQRVSLAVATNKETPAGNQTLVVQPIVSHYCPCMTLKYFGFLCIKSSHSSLNALRSLHYYPYYRQNYTYRRCITYSRGIDDIIMLSKDVQLHVCINRSKWCRALHVFRQGWVYLMEG